MKALVQVMLKRDVLDPQGKAIRAACGQLGYGAIESVRLGKLFKMELSARAEAEALPRLETLAGQLPEIYVTRA